MYSKSNKGYFRIQLIHNEDTAVEVILEMCRTFNVAQQQSLYKAMSQAMIPVTIGLVAGSTEVIIESPDLMELLKKKSMVDEIGLSWRFIQTGRKGKYDNDKNNLY